MRLEITKLKNIVVEDRLRKDLGDIEGLAHSIKTKGIIHPLAIHDSSGVYRLIAGGRRYAACVLAEIVDVPIRVYDEKLSPLELRSIELEENIQRKDLTFAEEVRLKKEINDVYIELKGPKIIDNSPEGHSMRDTASLLGQNISTVSQDIKLAGLMEKLPDLGWGSCKNKSDAMKLMAKTEEAVIHAELSKRAKDLLGGSDKKLADNYILGDFFESVKKIPSNSMDLVEVDPPYGIKLESQKSKQHVIKSGDPYKDIPSGEYLDFIEEVAKESYRVMNDHSWIIWWFGFGWFSEVFQTLTSVGFKGRPSPGIWYKTNTQGQTQQPDIYLGGAYEFFFYLYKGNATINQSSRGKPNVFPYPVVPPSQKIHSTERPAELMQDILNVFAWEGARIMIPFAGSGNTLVAADRNKMFPIGFDREKEFRDSFVKRLMEGGKFLR